MSNGKFTVDSVYFVLSIMDHEGLDIMRSYYICDSLFIVGLFIIQIVLTSVPFKYVKSKIPQYLLIALTVGRGLADGIENILLSYILKVYPIQKAQEIMIASEVTEIKFVMIRLWIILFIIGLVSNAINRKRNLTY
ncbi:MAG: hypothetical protein E7231_18060 [Cellulosilyticum sp.]|nr:hypothetical protein [Cellulosilyticum sp.]